MLYPKDIEEKLRFDKIRDYVEQECVSPLGQTYVRKMKFSANYELIHTMMAQTAEFCLILQTDSGFPSHHYIDVTTHLKRASLPGAVLYEEAFFDLLLSLNTIHQIIEFFKNRTEEKYPRLVGLMNSVIPEKVNSGWSGLIAEIGRVIDEHGQVKDNASPELYDIRKRLLNEQAAVKRVLERIYRTAKNSGWIGEDMTIAMRDGRMVLPILAEHKRKLSGYIHDETSSGNIAFVEPGEVLETNNKIKELQLMERREILRLLEQLTSRLRPEISDLEKSYRFLGLVDFIRAKAKFAIKTESSFPLLIDELVIDWQNARHPVLFLAHQAQKKPVVPLNVTLTDEARILVVSGPNAGGKSVMLKAIGLIQYMAQCGMMIPVSSDSKVGIFKSLFIDIGDEQSIENDLSTYSSHLTNMKNFLEHADRQTLFLIDEMGTGTEPSLGGALAEAILQNLNERKAFGVINTHYTNLKVFADKNEGVINGAMRFDVEKLSPLFSLEIGKPGNSFAFEVAEKIGLPGKTIKLAKGKLDKNQVNFEKLLKELNIEKQVFSEKNISLRKEIDELKQRSEQYHSLKTFLETDRKRIIEEAKNQAREIVKKSNKEIENTIRNIKESNAEREATLAAREKLKTFEQKVLKPAPIQVHPPVQPKVLNEKIENGDFVRIKGQEAFGQVLSINGNDVEVLLGSLKSNIKLNRLEKVSRKEFKNSEKKIINSMKGVSMNEKMTEFNFNLDVRGQRGEEALLEVDRLLDDALLLGYPQLRIVHGKGNGILRNLIRNHLKQYKQVGKMYDEHPDRGGAGVTIIDMK